MKRIPLWPFGKGLGVCSKGVLKQPQKSRNPPLCPSWRVPGAGGRILEFASALGTFLPARFGNVPKEYMSFQKKKKRK